MMLLSSCHYSRVSPGYYFEGSSLHADHTQVSPHTRVKITSEYLLAQALGFLTKTRHQVVNPSVPAMRGENTTHSPVCLTQVHHASGSNPSRYPRHLGSDSDTEVPAHATVFGTTELLEMVLFQLDMKSLLKAQQVCQRWKQTIAHSIHLQQALYLMPVKASNFQRTPHPLIEEIILPQLLLRSRNFIIPGKHPNFEPCFRQEASWREMLPSQSPSSTIGIIEIARHEKYTFTKLAIQPGSLRMEHLLNAMENGVLIPTPNNRVFWATVARSLNFEVWGQNWVQTKNPLPDGTPWLPANVDWDTLRLGVASMCLEKHDCDVVIVSEWPQRLFREDRCACQKTVLDHWMEESFGLCEVVAREEASHTYAFKEGNVPVLRQLCERCCCRSRFARRLFIP